MKYIRPALFSTCISLAYGSIVQAAPITIAHEGKSAFSIVVPQKAPQSLLDAAQELQRDIAESTGAQLPLLTGPEKVEGPFISLGNTAQAQAAGISSKDIALEGFRISTKAGNIFIAGPDTPNGESTSTGGNSTGTANGVYSFLEEQLGVRWLLPGNLGRDVPKKTSLTVNVEDRTETPTFFARRMPFMQNTERAVKQWESRQKLGYSVNVIQRPTWRKNVPPEMFETRPEWFPLIDGKRTLDSKNYKLETTDPELVKHFAKNAITALKANPSQYTASLSPTDYPAGWSQSEASKTLYDEKRWGYQMVTTLMLKFYSEISEDVKKEYPQGRLAGYIYDVYKSPPTNPEGKKYLPLPDNFYPSLANNADYGYRLYQDRNRKVLEELVSFWSGQTKQLTYYGIPNRLDVTSGVILPPAPGILNYLFPQLIKHRVKGVLLYGNGTWSEAAMNNYIVAKMMWNPQLDAKELQRDWLTRAYGSKAGATMEQLYIKLDDWFNQYYQTNPSGYVYNLNDAKLKLIYADHYPEMEKLFLQAKGETETSPQKARFQMLEDNLILLQATLREKNLVPADFASPLQRDAAEIEAIRKKPYADFQLFPQRLG